MANLFCAEEILKIGIKIRENGKAFYARVAGMSGSKDVKETFKWLAEEEEKHVKVLSSMLAGLDTCEQFEQYDEEYSSYVQVLIDKHKLAHADDAANMMSGIKTNADAINLAETFEKDSVLFLHEMGKFVRHKETTVIEDLIKGEQEQLTRLSKLKNCLTESDLNACLLT